MSIPTRSRLVLRAETIAASAVLFYSDMNGYAQSVVASQQSPTRNIHADQPGILFHVLLAITIVIVCGYLLGRIFRIIGQPPVIGEIIAGILLGPSLLGNLSPDAFRYLLSDIVVAHLGIIAQFGVVLYMFLLGITLDAVLLRRQAGATVVVSISSILFPLLLGFLLALYLHPILASNDVSYSRFAFFLGVALSISALPVLARILASRGIQNTSLGALALSCAAINAVAAWVFIALLIGVSRGDFSSAALIVVWTVVFVAVVFVVIKPLIHRLVAQTGEGEHSGGVVTMALVAMLLFALTAELIGLHALFGAFLLGVIIPHDCSIARSLTRKLEDIVTIVFLPAYFASTGMRTQIGAIEGIDDWLICLLIILTASVGKVGGTLIACRVLGKSWRSSTSLGVLMNTRGLMELIILNVGMDLGIITARLFAMMVIMAIVTSMATTPLLKLLDYPRNPNALDSVDSAEASESGK